MSDKILHITNGNSLTDYLRELNFTDDILTWQEMLCEGPTAEQIDTEHFFSIRKQFLLDYYDIEVNEEEFKTELKTLNNTSKYSKIILWFEYDLFCHINLMAVVSLLQQKNNKAPLYLVSSGRIKGENDLKGLSELSATQLLNHFEEKIKLSEADIDLLVTLWKTYCGKDHNLFKPYITKKSPFKYLSNCLKAHLRRFPDSKTGLSVLETNILEIVKKYPIKSRQHLLGYALNYQGYYGFGDIQLMRMIEKLSIFFDENQEGITLNRKGHEALLGQYNFSTELNNNMPFGGVNKFDFHFNEDQNKLIKTNINAY